MILVVGGTGDLGSRVVSKLCMAGEQVSCLVRPATDDTGLRAGGAGVARGDLMDSASLQAACVGVDTVVASATAIGRNLAGQRHPSIPQVDEHGMASLVAAAESNGVRRFVYVSFAGADTAFGSPLDRAKQSTESRLRQSMLRAVIVRPDAFQEIHLAPLGRFDIAAGKVAIFGRGLTPRRYVATDDVAALVASVAREADPPDVVEFGGPELVSREQLIELAERLTGRPIKRQRLPLPITKLAMRLTATRNPALSSVFGAGLMQDLLPATWDDTALRARNIAARSASDFIAEQVRAQTP